MLPIPEKIALGNFLRAVAGDRPIYWCPNPGNAGDSLISVATAQLFQGCGIVYDLITEPDDFDGDGCILCYGGGGNLVPQYTFARNFLARHHERAEHLIVLPHTIAGHEDQLGALGNNVTLICREAVSYAHCLRAAPRAEVYAADDLALSLAPAPWLGIAPGHELVDLQRLDAYCDRIAPVSGATVLESWRGDLEISERRPHDQSGDISLLLGTEMKLGLPVPFPTLLAASAYLLGVIGRFDSVRTDRLHVAIAGALLGKEVELYPNSTYKNRAVYDFSLQRYPRIRFIDWP